VLQAACARLPVADATCLSPTLRPALDGLFAVAVGAIAAPVRLSLLPRYLSYAAASMRLPVLGPVGASFHLHPLAHLVIKYILLVQAVPKLKGVVTVAGMVLVGAGLFVFRRCGADAARRSAPSSIV
jgi:hypothetical protein